jgi:hypothetical protein
MTNKADSENYVILEVPHFGSYEEFSCMGNILQYYKDSEDCKEAIVEQIAAKHQKISENQ